MDGGKYSRKRGSGIRGQGQESNIQPILTLTHTLTLQYTSFK